jgi:hypothetical protein
MMSRRISFGCPICRAALTRPLLALRVDQSICLEDGKAAVPEGFFGANSEEYWGASGQVIVNLRDLIGTKHHPTRLNGCCGLDGLDGPNLLCANGHEIGTEKSDCWMPHAAVLLDGVIWINE